MVSQSTKRRVVISLLGASAAVIMWSGSALAFHLAKRADRPKVIYVERHPADVPRYYYYQREPRYRPVHWHKHDKHRWKNHWKHDGHDHGRWARFRRDHHHDD